MDIEEKIASLERWIEILHEANERTNSMLDAACEQITLLLDRANETQASICETRDDVERRLQTVDTKLDHIGHKLYPTFYKVFPGMAAAEDALDRAVKNAGSNPKREP